MQNFSKMTSGEIETYLSGRAAVLFARIEDSMPPPLNVGIGDRGNRNQSHFAALLRSEGQAAYDAALRDELEARAGR